MRLHHSADVHRTLRNGLFCALVLVSVTSAGLLFDMANLQEINIYTVFVLGILVTAVLTASRLWSVVTSVLGVLIFNFLFADPRFSFQAVNFGYPLDFVILVGVALLVSTVASNSERLAYRTGILLQTDQLFLKASGVEEILTITVQRLQQLLNRPVVVYAVKGDKLDEPRYYGAADRADDDRAAAEWTYKNLEPSGARTPRFSRAGFLYSLIRTEDRRYGVIGVAAGDRPMSEMEANLVQALLNECALTLERDFYNQKRQEAAVQVRNEKLRADLLRSISHDLRTPLTSVLGSAGLLADNADQLSEQQKHKLYVDIRDDAQWLLGTVENLLAVTRIEDGKLSLRLQPELLGEVIPETLSHFRAQNGRIRFEQEDELLMARMDARLIMQVVTNLVDNALKYTPADAPIVVRTLRRDGMAVVEVADGGPGIPDEAKEKVFEMFYTTSKGKGDGRRGLGLGLALCKAIIAAHGGSICVRDNAPNGAVFSFTLPEERIEMS